MLLAPKILDMGVLAGRAEVMRMLGVGGTRLDELAKRPDFPEPLDVLSTGRIWWRSKIRDWAIANGRAIYDDESEAGDDS